MRFWVNPVSGGLLANQLAFMAELSKCGVAPDIALGSSGGNIANYVGLSANWQDAAIKKNALLLDSKMFAASWWPYYMSFMPSWMIGYWKGSLYADGTGATALYQKIFTPESIIKTEVWTGTLNRTVGQGEFFTNKNKAQALIKSTAEEELFADELPLNYLSGDVVKISQVTMASASIPILIPEKNISGSLYVDGGTRFSSPLSGLQEQIRDLIGSNTMHIDYFSSCNLNATNKSLPRTMYENSSLTASELVTSLCIADRQVAIEIIQNSITGQLCFAELPGNTDSIKLVEQIRKTCQRSVLEFYPTTSASLDIINFTGADVVKLMEDAQKNYKLRFWWIENGTEYPIPGRRVAKRSLMIASVIM